MNPGDMIQIQRRFRVFERGLSDRDARKMQEIVSIMVSPGDVYLLTKLLYHMQEYPQYNYATIELLVGGKTWITTITLDKEYEIEGFIKVFDFKNLDIENFESQTLREGGDSCVSK
jgi:hypothetical protein